MDSEELRNLRITMVVALICVALITFAITKTFFCC